ncbi:hypothetical protein ACJIZ3_004722 [Penstemon smallii]|uniref:Uncharacterized protein n=1 Tax=Penstemon smallii TaxID=265156 RepID=A0ABD3S2Y2_9LAMI
MIIFVFPFVLCCSGTPILINIFVSEQAYHELLHYPPGCHVQLYVLRLHLEASAL